MVSRAYLGRCWAGMRRPVGAGNRFAAHGSRVTLHWYALPRWGDVHRLPQLISIYYPMTDTNQK
ncbi:MAG: hypothetical protein VKL00_04545 [Synechococcales bacterium]|nr:hypothetical protein [Synechococcales bacterium]